MKKLLSVIVAVFLLAIILPSAVFAETAENNKNITNSVENADFIFNAACELFPEHADIICNPVSKPNGSKYRTQSATKVLEETRDYSDNLSITYTELSDGTVFLSSRNFTRKIEQVDSEFQGSYVIHYTCNMTVYSTYNRAKKLCVDGIEFNIDSISYDNITNRGEISSESVSHSFYGSSNQYWETSQSPAYTSYSADLPGSDGTLLDITVKFNVGNDSCYVTVEDDIITS